ncbi:hypothetical protein M9Y10_037542 [Tritrichomonas musculus]|uniref:Transmembrane protein n=1 Tax=Tritrichomonas musculus TaxID=1915356 RepID=A0ABR2GRN9_9EUKA
MDIFIFVFIKLSFSFDSKIIKDDNFPKQADYEKKSQNLQYSEQGFYNISISEKDTLNIFFKGRKQRLFFLIPYSPNFNIQNVSIDGTLVSIYPQPIGLSIEGTDNATLTFWSKIDSYQHQINFWIIPSELCSNSSTFVYGSNIIELHFRNTELCVFSPIFDSNNQKFTIELGVPFDESNHHASIYTKDFVKPYATYYDNDIHSTTVKTGNFVKFNLNQNDEKNHYSIFYRRRTKSIGSPYHQNVCEADSITRCTSDGCLLDIVDFVSVECNQYDFENIIVVLVIVSLFLVIVMILLIYFCLRRNKKKKDLGNLDNNPLNSENEIYTQSPVPEVIYPAQHPDTMNNYLYYNNDQQQMYLQQSNNPQQHPYNS